MTGNYRLGACLALMACVVAGCAIEDEGAIDYRSPSAPALVAGAGGETTIMPGGIKLVPLAGKYEPSQVESAQIKKGEFYRIVLKQGFIHEFYDPWSLGAFRFEKDGEIAIVANVFEIGDSGKQLNFGPKAREQANVIFFSSDVKQAQYLNLSQLPIYGPVEYHQGNSIVVQLIGVEIDQIDDRTMSLLKRMAALGNGAATAYNPLAGAASQVLTDLTLAFLSGNHDDIIFFYTFTLAPTRYSDYVTEDHLTEGTRILVKAEDRGLSPPWGDIQYDVNNGRLWVKKEGKLVEYIDNTYFAVDVTRADKGLTEAQLAKLEDLLKEIRENSTLSQPDVDAVVTSAAKLAREFSGGRVLDDALGPIGDKKANDADRRAAIFSLLTSIQMSLKEKDKGAQGNPALSDEAIGKGLKELTVIAARKPDFDLSLLSPDNVKSATNLNELTNKLMEAFKTAPS